MFSRFFIEHPIFANVIAIITMILGVVALMALPVAQYPEITPPTVQVTTLYPGANARTVAETVALPIEQQVNGVEKMLYMQSTSSSDGSYKLIVTFAVGTNIDMAQVLVQNRVASAMSSLPSEVSQQGVITKKVSSAILQVVTLTSPDDRYDSLYLSNYATINIRDELSRLSGVGDVNVFGAGQYGMRIWLNPETLKNYGLTPSDVVNAIKQQNVQVPAGQIGMPPAPGTQNFQYTINVQGRLSEVAEFEDIIVKIMPGEGGKLVRVRDVGRVDLGAQTYSQFCQLNGKKSAGVAIYQLPGANALATAKNVRQAMLKLSQSFPPGLEYKIPFDTTLFTQASIDEVYQTLFEAAILVLAVILIFLQNFRAVLVPATTVPVTIIGAFIAMAALGFSVNMVTLFALVLAIGIVVDDAIVIVEGAAHGIEQGLSPHDATIKAMSQLLGPIIGITLVLMAVFLPAAMLPGITGQLYRQFALVIAATAVISAINAMTLKPAQCALYLKPHKGELNRFYRWFNRQYDYCEKKYTALVHWMVLRSNKMMAVYVVLIAATLVGFMALPTGFLPEEDQGYAVVGVQLPDSAALGRTEKSIAQLDKIFADTPGVADWLTIGGTSLLDNSAPLSNAAIIYLIYKDFEDRKKTGATQEVILKSVRPKLAAFSDGLAFAVVPPAIQGLGVSSGFQMQLLSKGGGFDFQRLGNSTSEMLAAGMKTPGLEGLATSYRPAVPQLVAQVDRVKAQSLNVPMGNVFGALQGYLGSMYVNQFTKYGRNFQVFVQADSGYRLKPEDIRQLYTKSSGGEMVPLGTLVNVDYAAGPALVSLYNLYPTAPINGRASQGFSSGQALRLMEQNAAQKLPPDMGFQWTGMSYQERLLGSEAIFVFALAALLVYLVLAAQYESWFSPAAVILVVPLALLGTVVALLLRGYDNNVYTQIGLVLLIALASKNAILIVEYARELVAEGKPLLEAAVEASRSRFRPILMTSFAFILGVVPLAVAQGAGAASRRALGTAVIGGMLASTLLAVLFVPVCYVIMMRLDAWLRGGKAPAAAHGSHAVSSKHKS